jgi:hypothetical protein
VSLLVLRQTGVWRRPPWRQAGISDILSVRIGRFPFLFSALLLCAGLLAGGLPGWAEEPAPVGKYANPMTVQVGLFVLDLAKLDMKESEFYTDFYLWFKSPASGSIDWNPGAIEFMNGTVESATPWASEPVDGGLRTYWVQRVKGRFRGRFNLHTYPFDRQNLPIILEDSEFSAGELLFEPDPTQSADGQKWMEATLEVPDWRKGGATFSTYIHEYNTDFGLGAKAEARYSRFVFTMQLDRLFIPHLIKFVIPLLVIAGMAYMVFFINAKEFESQCGICVTSLLSAVALHISQADALPAVGYLVISDKIFILFYIVIFSALVQTVVVNNYAKRGHLELASWADDIFQWVFPLSLILGSLLIGVTSTFM